MRGYKKCFYRVALFVLLACLCGCDNLPEKKETTESDKTNEDVVRVETTEAATEAFFEEQSLERDETEATQEDSEESVYMYDLEASLQEILTNTGLSENTALYVQKLSRDAYATIGNHAMESASLIKLYVAGCVYENKDILIEHEAYDGETEELVRSMITVSDNDSTNTLVCRLGYGEAQQGMNLVNEYCQEHGFTDTSMGRLMLDFSAQSDNYTSVGDCADFLQKIYDRELEGSETILSYLKQQERTGKIPAGVPEDVVTANKTGELDDVENDAAIVFGENEAYVICIMMDHLADTSMGRDAMIELSSAVYTYINEK